jgi:DUF971 family protein
MSMKIRPTGVQADRNQRLLIINWNDGHISRLPFAGLRAVCPCVECKGGHENMGGPPDPRVVRDTVNPEMNIEAIQPSGSYAIQINWSDGHWTGIYTWEMLRAADPAFLQE